MTNGLAFGYTRNYGDGVLHVTLRGRTAPRAAGQLPPVAVGLTLTCRRASDRARRRSIGCMNYLRTVRTRVDGLYENPELYLHIHTQMYSTPSTSPST